MSYWHEKKKEDIGFSDDGKELHIYLYSDDNGAVYVSVEVKEVEKKLSSLKQKLLDKQKVR